MKTGIATYAAIALFVLAFPVIMGMGLFGFGFGGLLSVFGGLGNIAIALLFVISFAGAIGTFHFKEHVRRLLPWMIAFPLFILILNVLNHL